MEKQPMSQEEQSIRDYIRDSDMNLFVEAGAGAGKTYMLSERIVSQILKGEPLNSFVVITFTKAAAQELLDRIVLVLRNHLAKDGYTQTQKDILKQAIIHIDEMQVSTIHSFCHKILIENAFESGFVLDAEMIEDEEVEIQKRSFFYTWRQQHYKEVYELTKILDAHESAFHWYGSLYNAFDELTKSRLPVKYVEPDMTSLANAFIRVADHIRQDYFASQDSETKVLSNDTLLQKAYQMVMNQPMARKKIRAQYKHFYVDEFQDTDITQADMIWTLATNEDGNLRPNSIFLVGDPKQSIYRFRGADVSVFNAIKKRMMELPDDMARVFELVQNFRTNYQTIQGWINPTFKTVLQDGYTPMRSERFTEGVFNGTYRCPTIIGENGKEDKDDVNTIVQLVDEMMAVCPNDVSYKDFLIITYQTKHINALVQAFAQKNIPTAVRGKVSLQDDDIFMRYVKVYCGLLLDDPLMKAELKSLLSDLLYVDISPDQGMDIYQTIQSFLEETNFMALTPAASAKVLYDHTEMYLPHTDNIDMVSLRSAKIKIQQCIETCNQNVKGTKQDFARAMYEYSQSVVKRETPLQPDEDAVQIMNVHQTKGLSGKIVIIAERKKDASPKADTLQLDGYLYPSFSWDDGTPFPRERATSYDIDQELLDIDFLQQEDELKRLEYVAATRCTNTMIFMEKHSDNGWFNEELYEISKLPDINDVLNAQIKQSPLPKSQDTFITDNHLHDISHALQDDIFKQIPSISVSPSDFETDSLTGYSKDHPNYQSEHRPQGNVFGTIMHRVFELLTIRRTQWMRTINETSSSTIDIAIHQSINENKDDLKEEDIPFYVSFLQQKMSYYVQHVLPDIFDRAVNIYTEYPFTYTLEINDDKPDFLSSFHSKIYVNGTMDLVVEYDDRIVIYDYKSDARSGMNYDEFTSRMQKKYAKQLSFYAFSYKHITNTNKPIETKFIDLYRDEEK